MSVLVFTCPKTKEPLRSGIDTDAQSLALVRQLPVSIFCPACGRVHRFTVKDGEFIADTNHPLAPR